MTVTVKTTKMLCISIAYRCHVSSRTHLSLLAQLLPSCMSLALWMSEAISWLREVTSLRSSWFSRRRLDITWLCGSSVGIGSCVVDSGGTANPESELSGVSKGERGKNLKERPLSEMEQFSMVEECAF